LGVVPVRVPTALEIYLLAPALHAEAEAFRVNFLAHLFLLVSGRAHKNAGRGAELDANVAGALADHGRAAHGPRAVALDGRAVVDPDLSHEQIVGVHVVVVLVHAEDALHEALLHERLFLGGTRHLAPPSFPAPAHDHGVRTPVLLTRGRPLRDLAPGRNRRPTGRRLTLTTTVRMVHRVH